MGLDTYFNLTGGDGERRLSLWRKNCVAILWLACFRVSDIVFERDYPDCIEKIRCDITTARRQFEEGLVRLRQTFPDTDFEIGEEPHPQEKAKTICVIAFRELLAGMESGHVEIPMLFWADFSGAYIHKLFMHALLGFSYPGCKMFYDRSDVECGLYLRGEVSVPGVMTWGDALRALTLDHVGIALRQTEGDSRVHPPACLFTAYEYSIERRPLAGS